MRPLVWGVIFLFIGGFFWVIFSIFAGLGSAIGQESAGITALMYIFGIMLASYLQSANSHNFRKLQMDPE